eukprot:4672024-Prymnesium_polylepis.1
MENYEENDDLSVLLDSLSLSSFRGAFEEEEMTLGLLRSMSDSVLFTSLAELGLQADQSQRLAAFLSAPRESTAPTPASSSSAAPDGMPKVSTSSSPSPSPTTLDEGPAGGVTFEQRVLELQMELFAEDLEPPAEARTWSDARLRAYFE